ncbi:MAG: winged helix-turn-helix domain-containing protein [Burkholderiales bacterium]|jgi:DNA-binding winged helix-turn-helix (wHTH) protein/tetratricopeptide (TPR) repeat protein|nr:winged helix-turn-helix domain-containing protein [Burkholderiales bacterium]
MEHTKIRFDRCEVCINSREIVRDGVRQVLEPKPFDALIYLIEQRHRVVSKDELLTKLWPSEFVSSSVVPRAVMKARQAIGDDGQESRLIKTVHGAGYRFIGILQESAAPEPPDPYFLALLPFENRTGLPDLDWIELGLMSMVAEALSTDVRVRMPSIPSLLPALRSLPSHATPQDWDALRQLLGVSHVVHAAIGRTGDEYWLDYWTSSQPTLKRLMGKELTQLGERLASALEEELFAADGGTVSVAYESKDVFVNHAIARALQASAQQNWKTAINLFRMVLDIEPLNTGARLDLLRALACHGDDSAAPLGKELLALAEETGNDRLAIAVHQAIGHGCMTLHQFSPGKWHLAEAMRLADLHGLPDEHWSARIKMSKIAILERDFVRFHELIGDGDQSIESTANRVDALRALHYSALAATKQGDPVRGVQLGCKTVQLSKEYRLNQMLTTASLNLIYPCFDLGLMKEAVEHGEAALAAAQTLEDTVHLAYVTEALCWVYRELRAPAQSARVLTIAQDVDMRMPMVRAEVLRAHAHHAASEGAHDDALTCMREAMAICREHRNWLYMHELSPWLVMSLVLAERLDEATEASEEAHKLPEFRADPDLQAGLSVCRAIGAHSRGDHTRAHADLLAVVETAPRGLWRAYAGLNGAWLAVEAGNLDEANWFLRDLGPWLQEHPAGMALDARFKFARGQYAAAAHAHRRFAASIESPLSAYHAGLGEVYEAAERETPLSLPALPPAPRLPTGM